MNKSNCYQLKKKRSYLRALEKIATWLKWRVALPADPHLTRKLHAEGEENENQAARFMYRRMLEHFAS